MNRRLSVMSQMLCRQASATALDEIKIEAFYCRGTKSFLRNVFAPVPSSSSVRLVTRIIFYGYCDSFTGFFPKRARV